MKNTLHAAVWKEDKWYVAQSLEVKVASQGKNQDEALKNLKEALELYFEDNHQVVPQIKEASLAEVIL